jgi:hypothetical protein
MAPKFYPDSPTFEPLPDLLGVITQIDNMVTGLVRAPQERAAVTDEQIYALVAEHEVRGGIWSGPAFSHDGILQLARALLSLSASSEGK